MESRLKVFASIVDAGSFSTAAKLLRVSQPALSSSIKKLEREVGSSLIDRQTFQLSPSGRLSYKAGKQLQVDEQNLQTSLAELAGRKPRLRIGQIDSLAEILFVDGKAYDLVEATATLALSIDNTKRLIDSLTAGSIDMAYLVAGFELHSSGLFVQHKLGDEPFMLVTSSGQHKSLQVANKTGILTNFLSYNQASYTEKLIKQAAAQGGLSLETRFYATSPIIMLGMVKAGKGTAALPYHMIADDIKSGALLPIALNGKYIIKRPIIALSQKNHKLPEAAKLLTAYTSDALRKLNHQARQTHPRPKA